MILKQLQNHYGNRTAILEYENDCIYLYSYPASKNLPIHSLWVANTKKHIFKNSDIKSDMDKGLQPYLPKSYCNESAYLKGFKNLENWQLQWGMNQNSIAVYYKNEIVAILPEWSGFNGFFGYSKGINQETGLAWPLGEDNLLIQHFIDENNYLDSWEEAIWIDKQERLIETYAKYYSGESKYFAADNGQWPMLGIQYFRDMQLHFIATVGMSQLPMPKTGMNYEDSEDYCRIELALAFKTNENFQPLAEYLSGQAKLPWHNNTHYDHGHTIPCQQFKELNSNATSMLFVEKASFLPFILMPKFKEGKVRLLFMIAIYENEREYAENFSSQELIQLFEKQNIDVFDLYRETLSV